ncbi:MAG: TlpA disulfide reductase family protein [Gammaproteobacteria bacterium]|nr:TlpA family protein disulfide reductase [Pseudomonadales bacterium]MCP5345659.1 TlpA family protein disulfide reductase [Pseudomonadales bacterium]
MNRTISIRLAVFTLGFSLLSTALAVEEGEQAPDFTLTSIHENQPDFTLSQLRGKVVYLDFWASWCAPCLLSLPLYNELYEKYRDRGLEIVGINIDDPIEDGLDFLLDTPLDFTIPADPDGETPTLYDVYGMPTSYLIDQQGVIRLVHEGFREGDIEMIEQQINALLDQ